MNLRRAIRDGLADDQVNSVLMAVAMVIAAFLAGLLWGDTATLVVLGAGVTWLAWNRGTLLDRCDRAWDTADRALQTANEAAASLAQLLASDVPSGRHARRADR